MSAVDIRRTAHLRSTPTRRLAWRIGACLALTLLIGCASRQPMTLGTTAPPPDFALVLSFTQPPAHYILEPDGTLRAATGPGITHGPTPALMPPPTARLTPDQIAQLWALTHDAGLVTHPLSDSKNIENPGKLPPPALIATVTAYGQQHRTRHHAPLSPSATALLRRLVQLGGD